MYVAIEGIDTAGKSTQIQALKKCYPDAIFTKEPGGTDVGKKLREIALFGDIKSPLTELFIFLADRAEHIEEVIKPHLNKNLIISDRSVISGLAYGEVADKFTIEKLIELNKFACSDIFVQKVVILKLSEQELISRLTNKQQDKIEERGVGYLLDVQASLIKAAQLLDINTLIIDAALAQEQITTQILNFIAKEEK